jgi:hypothetical protein
MYTLCACIIAEGATERMPEMVLFYTWVAAIHHPFIQLGPFLYQMKADIVSYIFCAYVLIFT